MQDRLIDPSIDKLLKDAWARVEPMLQQNPAELARRLARRHKGILRNTPRAWCIVVRANDRRIHCWTSYLCPERPVWWDEDQGRWRYEPHEVDLEYENLVWLCRPQTLPAPGFTPREVAEFLGVTPEMVRYWIKRGRFNDLKRIRLGRPGRPVPIVHTGRDRIDPGASGLGRMRHPLWGTNGTYISDHIPRSLRETILRVPTHGRGRFDGHFGGWRWICPVCGRRAKRIYYPLPCLLTASFVKPLALWDLSPDERRCRFACRECNRVYDFASQVTNAWNHVVSHLSGGLLYGREVKRPASFVIPRRVAYHARHNRTPARRPAQITQLLVHTTLTCRQIAQRLGIHYINATVTKIYREHKVGRRDELRRLLLVPAQAAG